MADVQITTEKLGNSIVFLSLAGHLDSITSVSLEETFQKFYDQQIYKFIVATDGLSYISSRGISIFASFLDKVRHQQGDLVLVNPARAVKSIFDMLGLTKIITIVPDQESAVKYLQKMRDPLLDEEMDDWGVKSGELQITTKKLPDNVILITAKGYLDSITSVQFEEAMFKFYDQGVFKFILDLSELNYLSTRGVRILTEFRYRVK
ncbi:MAG: STAS domain-containing protein [Planctomycetes bacterium]|nr:STAS domain-containing protein [Planctomycetota bacterium]